MKTWQKTILRFCVGGGAYFLIELVWRWVLERQQGAHPIMILPAGTVLALICFLDDRRLNILINALVGALTVVSFELAIGLTAYNVYGVFLWYYGKYNENIPPICHIISLKWAMIWFLLCFACILVKRIWEKNYFWKNWNFRKRKD